MSVAVVIPALDAARTIGDLLAALCRQSPPPDEIIVADNGSLDQTASIVRAFAAGHPSLRIDLVTVTTRGPGAARNAGAAAARAEILAFVDADCEPATEWLRRLTEPLERGDADVAVGRVEALSTSTDAELFQALMMPVPEPDAASRPLPSGASVMTGSLAVRATTFRQLGGFDERLRWHEDTAFGMSLERSAIRALEVPAAIVRHRFPASGMAMARRGWKYGITSGAFLRISWHRRFAIEATRSLRIDTSAVPGHVWIVLSPDKIVGLTLLPALITPAGAALVLLPLAYYSIDLRRRAARRGIRLPAWRVPGVLALDLVYHAVLSAGRLLGSFPARVLCL